MKYGENSKPPLTSGRTGCIMSSLRKLNKQQKGGTMLDYSKLRGAIRAKFNRQDKFAKALEISPCGLSLKLNGKAEWTAKEIRRACELLDLNAKDIPDYFFCRKS